MKRLASSVAAILLVCACAFQLQARAEGDWLRVQSRHFTIVGNVAEPELRRITASLEEFLPALAAQDPGARGRTENITVLLFNDEASHEPFRLRYGGVTSNAPGYFLAGQDLNFIAIAPGASMQTILFHELFHALSRQDGRPPLPAWASEGLAEYYSTFETSFGKVIPEHVATLRSRPWIPLSDLLATARTSPIYNETERQQTFYAQSWALTHYFLAGNDGKRRGELIKYLDLQVFEIDIAVLELELREYVSRLLTDSRIQAATTPDPMTPMQVTAMTEAAVAASFGSLLFQLNRLDAAEEQLQRALEVDPDFTDALTAMGRLRVRQDRNSEALPLFRKALELDDRSYLAHFHYAAVLQNLSLHVQPDERLRRLNLSQEHLKKTIELAPWFLEPYRWLGYVAIALEDGYLEAELALKRAIEREPDVVELRTTLAEVQEAFNRRQESERQRRERESREQRASLFQRLRKETPPMNVRAYVWTAPPIPPPPPKVVYPTLEGFLVAIECRDGLTLVLRSGERIVRFHTKTPIKLEFTSKVSRAAEEAGCGPVRPEHRVVVTYRRSTDRSIFGEPIRIEYK